VAITAASFRADFEEFANSTQYPTAVIVYYLALAAILLNPQRWGGSSPTTVTNPPTALIDFAAELFVAHYVTLEYQAQLAARAGGAPGTQTGAISAKSVGPISVSFDNMVTNMSENTGQWALTVYGKRFFELANMAGAGPMQVGWGVAPSWSTFQANGGPWLGPVTAWPGWFQST
jgi:Protein of unknown function (DUF4054)